MTLLTLITPLVLQIKKRKLLAIANSLQKKKKLLYMAKQKKTKKERTTTLATGDHPLPLTPPPLLPPPLPLPHSLHRPLRHHGYTSNL